MTNVSFRVVEYIYGFAFERFVFLEASIPSNTACVGNTISLNVARIEDTRVMRHISTIDWP